MNLEVECKKEQVNADTQQLSKYMFEDHWDKKRIASSLLYVGVSANETFHLHDGAILLLLPESFYSCEN